MRVVVTARCDSTFDNFETTRSPSYGVLQRRPVRKATPKESQQLTRWARQEDTTPRLAQRSRIVLAGDKGMSKRAVAQQEGVSTQTVTKWRSRFDELGLDGLIDAPGARRSASTRV
jgi:transposase